MSTENKNGAGADWLWVALTPLILAAAAGICIGLLYTPFAPLAPMFIGIGLFFLPALSVYLDGRSRTYTGIVTLGLGMALSVGLLGAPAVAVSACVVIVAVALHVLAGMKVPFSTGLVGSAAGGVLGFVALLGILGGSAGSPLNETAAASVSAEMASQAAAGLSLPLDMLTVLFKAPQQAGLSGLLSGAGAVPAEILSMSVAQKIDIVRPALETMFAIAIPSFALAGGMVMGALGYWLPMLALSRRARKQGAEPAVAVPPLATFKVPKYMVITLLLLQIVSSFGSVPENLGWLTVSTAVQLVMGILMDVQAMALVSFFLNRKKVAPVFQVLIFIPMVIFSGLTFWVGIFDALFDMRAVLPRVEEVRAKGKQVFTPEGLEELRKIQQVKKDKDNNGKNGEDGKQ